jgi:hypothetical protein
MHGRSSHRLPVDWPGPIVACNDIGVWWPGRLDHWCSLHGHNLVKWLKHRTANELQPAGSVWSTNGPGHRRRNNWGGGSSGMLASAIALDHGRLGVLCGIPMEPMVHFQESAQHKPNRPWTQCNGHWRAWNHPNAKHIFMGRLKCGSLVQDAKSKQWHPGRMSALVGEPTAEWIAQALTSPVTVEG